MRHVNKQVLDRIRTRILVVQAALQSMLDTNSDGELPKDMRYGVPALALSMFRIL